MPRRGRVSLVILVVVGALGSPPCAADDATNAAAAQVLFDQGKALMDKGDYLRACTQLEESQKVQAAGGTLLFLALCREGEGKTATAWTRFNETVSMARRDGRSDRE